MSVVDSVRGESRRRGGRLECLIGRSDRVHGRPDLGLLRSDSFSDEAYCFHGNVPRRPAPAAAAGSGGLRRWLSEILFSSCWSESLLINGRSESFLNSCEIESLRKNDRIESLVDVCESDSLLCPESLRMVGKSESFPGSSFKQSSLLGLRSESFLTDWRPESVLNN